MMLNHDLPDEAVERALRHIKSISWQRREKDILTTGDAYGDITVNELVALGVPRDAITCDVKRKPNLLRVEGEQAVKVLEKHGVVYNYWAGRASQPAASVASR